MLKSGRLKNFRRPGFMKRIKIPDIGMDKVAD